MRSETAKQTPRWPGWVHLLIACAAFGLIAADSARDPSHSAAWQPFSFLSDDDAFGGTERLGLFLALGVSVIAIVYAFLLGKRVFAADQGTSTMRDIAQAVRDGSNAYLKRQFTTVGVLLLVLTVLLVLSKWPWTNPGPNEPSLSELKALAVSRGLAFFVGALFSAAVGFYGMRLATTGNLRVAAAARRGFHESMKLGYQTGIVTGMLTTGLGLLGGCVIVLVIGEKAYETLLGFAFGGSLLALFMRVGGGIYTKAADVGADLVGKVEAGIPEDDPRNAATIADNVGDNVGDCAGMAADVFESYTVTMVAAMILGYAAMGPKAMLFPLFVQAIGIVSSMISTSLVGRGSGTGGASDAMKIINNSFRIGALVSVVGFMAMGYGYLRFDAPYIVKQAFERGLATDKAVLPVLVPELRKHGNLEFDPLQMMNGVPLARHFATLPPEAQQKIAELRVEFADTGETLSLLQAAQKVVPVKEGLDMRPAFACLVGIFLTLALMFCTEFWTSTEYSPVKSIAKSSRTGHATNIIQGIAVGYESTVWSVLLIAAAISGGVLIYQDTLSPIFVAFGVSLCGIGMLTLTGDTLAMDVFGPVADNANGIGEMGYNRDAQNRPLKEGDPDFIPAGEYAAARKILSDLDATGNTTKAITKGIAIGSAVIAAVSLFASFIAVLVKGSEEAINQLTIAEFEAKRSFLSVATPEVFIGMLIGGAVPFLFSSMTIRAVGRAAFLIVNECRRQFKDPAILDGTKRPDYGRVVSICTRTAQKELVGPGLLAIFAPVLVGFLLGPYALGGFLAGMILVGQLLAVFMATSGGAWDNAKKMIEDQPKTPLTGKGSEMHKASVTGDTVGDPLKDTAGPAINPLIKVMNMVSLLVLPLVIVHNLKDAKDASVGAAVIGVSLLAIAWAWFQSKRETEESRVQDAEFEKDLQVAMKQTPQES